MSTDPTLHFHDCELIVNEIILLYNKKDYSVMKRLLRKMYGCL